MTDMLEAYNLLDEQGRIIASDVKGTYPNLDVAFDLYVESGLFPECMGQVFGVIDMGDTGQWVFQLTENDRYDGLSWTDVSGIFNPIDIKRRIIATRRDNHGTDAPPPE